MKLALFLLVAMVMFCTSDALFRRRRVHITNNTIVRCYCVVNCGPRATCKYNCNFLCKGRKRSGEEERSTPAEGFNLVLPCKLEAWDSNKDGFIELDEFLFTAHSNMEDQTGIQLFGRIDLDGDNKISTEEFERAPLVKEKC